jgi:hypothetical protein
MLTLGVAVGGGCGRARMVHTPRPVEIGNTACGLPIADARFGVPRTACVVARRDSWPSWERRNGPAGRGLARVVRRRRLELFGCGRGRAC